MRQHTRWLVVALLLCTACTATPSASPLGVVVGRVVGLDGEPVADAQVSAGGTTVRTGGDGGFEFRSAWQGSWVTVSRAGYLSRTRAAVPGDPLLVRLTPDDGETVALQFGGDVMMGRRFYDPDEDGDRSDAVIADPADVAEHRALLEPIAPLLATADLTVVNVESPVVERSVLDTSRPRLPGLHPTKSYVFASGPALPAALAGAGVDVVGLANNHQYDLLDEGVRSTVDHFAAGGFATGSRQFGLGDTVEEAFRPAITQVRGQRIAFLGCTTIIGDDQEIGYVAAPDRSGAAPCEEARVREAVAAAAAASDLVVFGVHGGNEYDRQPSPDVALITQAARAAGATLVINHHPHVVGGLDWDGTGLAAWSLGNLVFDQTVWPTFQSYVLTVHVRRGEVVRAYLEPVMIDGYVAHGVDTALADHVARTAVGLSRGPFVVEDGTVELDLRGTSTPVPASVPVSGSPAGRIAEIGEGWLLERADPATSRFGRDLLWVGDLDGGVVGSGTGALWTTSGDALAVPGPAEGSGSVYRLRRADTHAGPAVGGPLHRMLLENTDSAALRRNRGELGDGGLVPFAGGASSTEVSLTGRVRVDPGARVEVQLSWYPDTRGPSSSQTVQVVEGTGGADGWQQVRMDAPVPADAVAVGLILRLSPPLRIPGRPAPPSEVTADADGFRLVEWAPPGAPPNRGATHLRTDSAGSVQLSRVSGADGPVPPPLVEVPD